MAGTTTQEGEERDEAGAGAQRDIMAMLREANEKLILAALHSQELTEQAEQARARAEQIARDLEASERELRHVAELRERLIGVVGHDLRNPLHSISINAEMLAKWTGLDEATAQTAIRRIRSSAGRMSAIISDLLDFTRAHLGGGIPLRPRPVNLEAVCRTVLEELQVGRVTAAKFRCQFVGDLDGTWDGERLAQVISNLAGNAIEHGAPGDPISIEAKDGGDRLARRDESRRADRAGPASVHLRPVPSRPVRAGVVVEERHRARALHHPGDRARARRDDRCVLHP